MRKILFAYVPILAVFVIAVIAIMASLDDPAPTVAPPAPAANQVVAAVSNETAVTELGRNERLCPVRLTQRLRDTLVEDYRANVWQLYRTGPTTPAPEVEVVRAGSTDECMLRIVEPVEEPGEGIDWRLGHILTFRPDAGDLKISARVRVVTDRSVEADTATAYLASLAGVRGTSMAEIGPGEKVYSFALDRPSDVPTTEFWVRLALNDGVLAPRDAEVTIEVLLDAEPVTGQ